LKYVAILHNVCRYASALYHVSCSDSEKIQNIGYQI
jgi:hypothetical protein